MTALADALPGPLPTADEELWRYSRIGELDLDRYQPAASPTAAVVPDAELARLRDLGPSALVVLFDGHLVHAELDPALQARGLRVATGGDAERDAGERPDVFAGLNEVLGHVPVVVDVPRGLVVPGPVVVVNVLLADGVAVFPRLVVRAGTDSEVTVLDQLVSPDVSAFVAPVVDVRTEPAARLRYLSLNQLGPRAWQVGSVRAVGERDSRTALAAVALGGDYARLRIDARLDGPGASGEQVAVYFGDGRQMHDFRTLQDHAAPHTTSNLLFKGAVGDRSRSVYSGLIRVRKDARGSTAFQTNRNIKLSEDAWAESVPNLEIETNDVRCSHASAVGPIDEAQRFYLESRGVPGPVAERLIVLGFFDEVLAGLPVPGVVEPLRRQVAAKLEAQGIAA